MCEIYLNFISLNYKTKSNHVASSVGDIIPGVATGVIRADDAGYITCDEYKKT